MKGADLLNSREKMYMEFMAFGNLLKRSNCTGSNLKKLDNSVGNNIWILMFIQDNMDRDIFQKDIEENFMMSRSTVSKIITQMEQKGLIIREAVDHDARLKKLTLTPKALEMYNNAEAEAIDHLKKITKDLTDEEIEEFIRILRKIEKNI